MEFAKEHAAVADARLVNVPGEPYLAGDEKRTDVGGHALGGGDKTVVIGGGCAFPCFELRPASSCVGPPPG